MVAAGVLLIGFVAAGAYPRFTQGLTLVGGIGAAGAAWMVAAGAPDRSFLAPLAAVTLSAGAVFLLGVNADRGHSRFG